MLQELKTAVYEKKTINSNRKKIDFQYTYIYFLYGDLAFFKVYIYTVLFDLRSFQEINIKC